MLILERKIMAFTVKSIYHCDYPFDIPGCDAVIINYCRNKVEAPGFLCSEQPTSVIDLTQSPETIWGNMNQTRRKSIRSAEKESIQVGLSREYEEFYNLITSFQKKKGYYSYLDIQHPDVETLEKYGTLFVARKDGEFLVGNVYLETEDSVIGWVGASRRLEVDKEKAKLIGQVNSFLHWKVINYAKEKGLKEYDMGGFWTDEEAAADIEKQNMNFFKLSLGAKKVDSYKYTKSYSLPYKFARNLNRLFHLAK